MQELTDLKHVQNEVYLKTDSEKKNGESHAKNVGGGANEITVNEKDRKYLEKLIKGH